MELRKEQRMCTPRENTQVGQTEIARVERYMKKENAQVGNERDENSGERMR